MVAALLKDSRLFLILIILSILIFLTDSINFLNLPKNALQTVTIPIQYGLYKTGQSLFKQFEFVFLARRAAQENKALTEQLAHIISENANLRRKLAETEGTIDQQNTLSPQTYNMVAARPIGIARLLKIDKGLSDNIAREQAVVFKDNYIGMIKDISSKQSEVMLSSDPDSKIAAFVSSIHGKSKGVLFGQYGSDMLLDKILHQEPVEKGDLVYSEGSEGKLPRGLILGQVTEVLVRENEVFKQAKVKPIFDIADLDIVFVITN